MPRIYTVMSEQVMRVRRSNLHRLDGVVGVLDGFNLDMLDGVWEEELAEDVELACLGGQSFPRGYAAMPPFLANHTHDRPSSESLLETCSTSLSHPKL